MSISAPVIAPTSPSRRPLLVRELRKWQRMAGIFAQDALAYRAVMFIWIMTDTIPALIMPLLWLHAFNGRSQIGGFAPSQITAYYLVLLGVTNLVQCHQMWEIAADIKEGRFSTYLIRPFSYRTMNYLAFASWRIMRTGLLLPIFVVATFLFHGTLRWSDCHPTPFFFLSLLLGHFVSFFMTYAVGLAALYFVETRSLFNFWYMPVILFSGQLAPIALFPPGARQLAEILPFRYTIALPTEIFLGRLTPHQLYFGLLMQIGWIVATYLIGTLLWRGGLKRFTGVGL